MENFINTITLVEWGLLGIAVLALLLAFMAWRRAGRALQLLQSQPVADATPTEESEQHTEQRPAVSLELTADKDEYEQVSLVISNTGRLAARHVKLNIDAPVSIYDAENLGAGIESADVTKSSAILPRLTVLDAENKLPVKELLTGNTVTLPAALTMSHGKICDYPVTMTWKDENGTSHEEKLALTV